MILLYVLFFYSIFPLLMFIGTIHDLRYIDYIIS